MPDGKKRARSQNAPSRASSSSSTDSMDRLAESIKKMDVQPLPPNIARPKPMKPNAKKDECPKKDDKKDDEGTSYKKGGRVKKTGSAKLHKDEIVLPVSLAKQLAKLMK